MDIEIRHKLDQEESKIGSLRKPDKVSFTGWLIRERREDKEF